MVNGASSADFYIDAVTNNSFEMKYVEETLQSVLYNSYGFLDNFQKHSIALSRFNFLVTDLIGSRELHRHLKLQIEKDLIDPSAREEYRKSKLYREVMPVDVIGSNENLFAKMPIVFIDGVLVTKYSVKAFFDTTFIYFKDTPELRSHKEITVIFVPNDGIVTGYVTKRDFNSEQNKLPARKFNTTEIWKSPLTSIVGGNALVGTSSNMIYSDGSNVEIEFNDDVSLILDENSGARVTVLKSRYMHTLPSLVTTHFVKENDDGTHTYTPRPFVLTDDDGDAFKMPIPIENILIYKRAAGESEYRLDNTITLRRIYPNIYVIDDNNCSMMTSYRVVYFYYPMDGKYHYTNYMENFHYIAIKYYSHFYGIHDIEGIVADILMGPENFSSINEYNRWLPIVTYEPPEIKYCEHDILKGYDVTSGNTPAIYPFDYKIDKLCEAIRNDPWILRDYVKNQSHCNYGYELYIKTIANELPSRRRSGSGDDAKFLDHRKTFSEPCYLFRFNIGSKINFELTFFIDGLYIQPEYVFEEFFTKYIYLPCRLVDGASLIDIEENHSYIFEKTVSFTNSQIQNIVMNIPGGSNIHPLMKNIHIKDESGYTLLHDEMRQNFEISEKKGNLSYSIINHEYAPVEGSFDVELIDNTSQTTSEGKGLTYTIVVDKRNIICDYTSDEDPILVTMMPREFFDDQERVRIFVNGRLIDPSAVMILYYDSLHSVLLVKVPLKIGDVVNVLLSPNFYRKVFSMANIPNDGIIRLAYELNKPINVAYYDFYLNGRKLTSRNIIQLSPSIIQICDVESKLNLVIYEKDRDPTEYFGEKSGYRDNYDTMKTFEDEVFAKSGNWVNEIRTIVTNPGTSSSQVTTYMYSFRNVLLYKIYNECGKTFKGYNNLEDKEDDILAGMISDETADMIICIFKTMYLLHHINPDLLQIDGEDIKAHFQNAQHWLASDSSTEDGVTNVFRINPDICADNTEIIQPVSGDKFYTQYKIDYEEKEQVN